MAPLSAPKIKASINSLVDSLFAQVDVMAAQYRDEVMLPICRRLRLRYLAGMGETLFVSIDDEAVTIASAWDAKTLGYKSLVPVFETLGVEIVGNDVFGYRIDDITEEDVDDGQ